MRARCGRGGIGRRAGFRSRSPLGVEVRVLSPAPLRAPRLQRRPGSFSGRGQAALAAARRQQDGQRVPPRRPRPVHGPMGSTAMPHLVAAPDKFGARPRRPRSPPPWPGGPVRRLDRSRGPDVRRGRGSPRRRRRHEPYHDRGRAPAPDDGRMAPPAGHGHPRPDRGDRDVPGGRPLPPPPPPGDDPVRADTAGVGRLLLAARDAGARRIVIGLRRFGHHRRRLGRRARPSAHPRRWPGSNWSWPAT